MFYAGADHITFALGLTLGGGNANSVGIHGALHGVVPPSPDVR
jgi:hypothetical protein